MSNEQRTTQYAVRNTHSREGHQTVDANAFTLLEMVVAIAILAMVIFFAGGIFKSGIESYRTAMAQAEIMQKLRAITHQLDSDFRGLRKDAPLFIWFDQNDINHRLDQIMFFADGDFQSTQLYSGSPIVGNVARIQYGQAMVYSPSLLKYIYPWEQWADDVNAAVNYDRFRTKRERTLARRQHVFAYNFTNATSPLFPTFGAGPTGLILTIDPSWNNILEYDSNSISQWQAAANDPTNGPANVGRIITACFGVNCPKIDFADAGTLHLLMTEGVGSFSVQWSYLYTDAAGQTHIYWWPSGDPDGDPATLYDSDFIAMAYKALSAFGFYFNAADPPLPTSSGSYWFSYNGAEGSYYPLAKPVYPQALKFTFTLYDSRGIFKQGQTFTHIVYLGD